MRAFHDKVESKENGNLSHTESRFKDSNELLVGRFVAERYTRDENGNDVLLDSISYKNTILDKSGNVLAMLISGKAQETDARKNVMKFLYIAQKGHDDDGNKKQVTSDMTALQDVDYDETKLKIGGDTYTKDVPYVIELDSYVIDDDKVTFTYIMDYDDGNDPDDPENNDIHYDQSALVVNDGQDSDGKYLWDDDHKEGECLKNCSHFSMRTHGYRDKSNSVKIIFKWELEF